jgi:hypothetical protein
MHLGWLHGSPMPLCLLVSQRSLCSRFKWACLRLELPSSGHPCSCRRLQPSPSFRAGAGPADDRRRDCRPAPSNRCESIPGYCLDRQATSLASLYINCSLMQKVCAGMIVPFSA